jgi:hypothetical protein
MQLPKLEGRWTVAFMVDASRCASSSGSFPILFRLWKETAPDVEFAETFGNLVAARDAGGRRRRG